MHTSHMGCSDWLLLVMGVNCDVSRALCGPVLQHCGCVSEPQRLWRFEQADSSAVIALRSGMPA